MPQIRVVNNVAGGVGDRNQVFVRPAASNVDIQVWDEMPPWPELRREQDLENARANLAQFVNDQLVRPPEPPEFDEVEEQPKVPITLNTTVKSILSRAVKRHTGSIGIELEAEGEVNPFRSVYWNTVEDGSLRRFNGYNGLEYILNKPIMHQELDSALSEFTSATSGNKYNDSLRTSCHVHFNAQNYTFNELYAIVAAYWLFEDLLVEHCGTSRVGNLFCLRASDASSFVTDICRSIRNTYETNYCKFIVGFSPEQYKYAALNLSAVSKFGSMEFRSMRGIYTQKEIKTWVNTLWTMINKAKALGSAVKVFEKFKELSPKELVEYFFEDYSRVICDLKDWKDSIKKSSMFTAQLAYVVNKAENNKYERKEEVVKQYFEPLRPQPRVREVPSFSRFIIDFEQPINVEGEELVDLRDILFENRDL